MAGMYDYERNLADTQDRYAQDNATNAYARFISQQRFSRNRDAANQTFQRGFPSGVVGLNHGMGSNVQSGVFRDKLGQAFGDFSQGMGNMEADQASQDSQFAQSQVLRDAQYQRALLLLQEQLGATQAAVNPFASYSQVWGN